MADTSIISASTSSGTYATASSLLPILPQSLLPEDTDATPSSLLLNARDLTTTTASSQILASPIEGLPRPASRASQTSQSSHTQLGRAHSLTRPTADRLNSASLEQGVLLSPIGNVRSDTVTSTQEARRRMAALDTRSMGVMRTGPAVQRERAYSDSRWVFSHTVADSVGAMGMLIWLRARLMPLHRY